MKNVLKTRNVFRISALAAMMALSPLAFSQGTDGNTALQLSEATCTTCCPEEAILATRRLATSSMAWAARSGPSGLTRNVLN